MFRTGEVYSRHTVALLGQEGVYPRLLGGVQIRAHRQPDQSDFGTLVLGRGCVGEWHSNVKYFPIGAFSALRLATTLQAPIAVALRMEWTSS